MCVRFFLKLLRSPTIPTEESIEEVIPKREEHHADAPKENCSEENVEKIPRHQPAHPRIAKEVQVEKIINDIKAPVMNLPI